MGDLSPDVVTTAMLRPALLEQTYASFLRAARGFAPRRLIINIDPFPRGESTVDEVLGVARRFFPVVVHRAPERSSFPGAVNWLWETADTDPVVHLEDDWKFVRVFDFPLAVSRVDDGAAQVRLRCKPGKPRPGRLGLQPSLLSRRVYKTFAGRLSLVEDPECQIHDLSRFDLRPERCRVEFFPDEIVVKDAGRAWLKQRRLSRGVKADFVAWE